MSSKKNRGVPPASQGLNVQEDYGWVWATTPCSSANLPRACSI